MLYETLTVYETLFYAGMLRLPRKMSNAEKVLMLSVLMLLTFQWNGAQ